MRIPPEGPSLRRVFAFGNWLGRTLTGKFILLLFGFLALQILQVVIGILAVPQIGEEGASIHQTGLIRVQAVFVSHLLHKSMDTGAWNPGDRRTARFPIWHACWPWPMPTGRSFPIGPDTRPSVPRMRRRRCAPFPVFRPTRKSRRCSCRIFRTKPTPARRRAPGRWHRSRRSGGDAAEAARPRRLRIQLPVSGPEARFAGAPELPRRKPV